MKNPKSLQTSSESMARRCAIVIWFFATWPVSAGFYSNTVSPGNVPWPGGTVPYVIDPALSATQQQTYLNGLREWELAANVHFTPWTTETKHVFFTFSSSGPNQVSENADHTVQTVAINLLTRGQICHEMGHSFGLLHEHVRPDRNTYVNFLSGNVASGDQHWFDIDPNGTAQGAYDYESVMHFSRNLFSIDPPNLDALQAKSPNERFQPRMGGFALSKGDRAVMKFLYGAGPVLSPAVTNTSESGVGGLRAALHYATDNPGTTITFNIPTTDPSYANGVFTIGLTGHLLPFVVDGTIIDATTQPGYAGSPLIVLDGSQILPEAGAVPATVPGIHMFAANCTVKGISVQRFPWVGLAFLYSGSHNNTVRACRFGLDYLGTSSAPNYQGLYISSDAYSNTIGGTAAADRNVISGNTQYGVWISGANTTSNVVLGNYIGTKADGLSALPNAFGGLIITDNSHNNTIGGTSAAARNIISGNTNAGIWITGAGVNQNTVRNNYIGLAANGSAAVPNSFGGLYLFNGAQNNLVADNVISGNFSEGVRIADLGTSGNMVQGNRVGLAPAGNATFPNGFGGITILSNATGNTIGGTTAAQRNILSGNGTVGLVFSGSGASGNIAVGNYIGTDATGTVAVANGFAGVYITAGATANQLGGLQGGTGNLISGNNSYGVYMANSGTNGNLIRGNFIGTNAGGTAALPNGSAGIDILDGAQNNMVGDGTVGGANLIAFNSGDGVIMYDPTTTKNKITQNSIFSNGGLGIKLTPNGSNLKPNNAEPSPGLISAALSTSTNPNGTDVSGNFTGGSGTIELFASPSGAQGRYFVGSIPAASAFTAHLAAVVPTGYAITATATDSIGNTSEFSPSTVVPSPSDNGADGLPDEWMLAHFTHIDPRSNDQSRASDDADGDGLTNLQEFRAGTDPKIATSKFRITAIAPSGNNLGVTFASTPGKTYRVEYKDSITSATWILLEDQLPASAGTMTQVIDASASSLAQRFYRVTILP